MSEPKLVNDPYAIPASDCLANKLGLVDADRLNQAEARIVSIRDVELARSSLPGEYNLEHLQRFHFHLFQDVYAWAGQLRTVDIGKGNTFFANWKFVGEQVSAVLAELESTLDIPFARATAGPSEPSCGSFRQPPDGDWTGPS